MIHATLHIKTNFCQLRKAKTLAVVKGVSGKPILLCSLAPRAKFKKDLFFTSPVLAMNAPDPVPFFYENNFARSRLSPPTSATLTPKGECKASLRNSPLLRSQRRARIALTLRDRKKSIFFEQARKLVRLAPSTSTYTVTYRGGTILKKKCNKDGGVRRRLTLPAVPPHKEVFFAPPSPRQISAEICLSNDPGFAVKTKLNQGKVASERGVGTLLHISKSPAQGRRKLMSPFFKELGFKRRNDLKLSLFSHNSDKKAIGNILLKCLRHTFDPKARHESFDLDAKVLGLRLAQACIFKGIHTLDVVIQECTSSACLLLQGLRMGGLRFNRFRILHTMANSQNLTNQTKSLLGLAPHTTVPLKNEAEFGTKWGTFHSKQTTTRNINSSSGFHFGEKKEFLSNSKHETVATKLGPLDGSLKEELLHLLTKSRLIKAFKRYTFWQARSLRYKVNKLLCRKGRKKLLKEQFSCPIAQKQVIKKWSESKKNMEVLTPPFAALSFGSKAGGVRRGYYRGIYTPHCFCLPLHCTRDFTALGPLSSTGTKKQTRTSQKRAKWDQKVGGTSSASKENTRRGCIKLGERQKTMEQGKKKAFFLEHRQPEKEVQQSRGWQPRRLISPASQKLAPSFRGLNKLGNVILNETNTSPASSSYIPSYRLDRSFAPFVPKRFSIQLSKKTREKLKQRATKKGPKSINNSARLESKPYFSSIKQTRIVANIQNTLNNTIITITDRSGNTKLWCSSGSIGLKASRRSTNYAAQSVAETVAKKCIKLGIRFVEARVQGVGYGKPSALKGLRIGGLIIQNIVDTTSKPHNGCRAPKQRRV